MWHNWGSRPILPPRSIAAACHRRSKHTARTSSTMVRMAQMHATPPVASSTIIHLQQNSMDLSAGCLLLGTRSGGFLLLRTALAKHTRHAGSVPHQGMSEAEGRLSAAHEAVMPTVTADAPSCRVVQHGRSLAIN